MSLSEAQQRQLEHLLTGLSSPAATKLLMEIERAELKGVSQALPSHEMREALRGVVAVGAAKPARTPTPLRLFCSPFEELLVDDATATKEIGRISRKTLPAVWGWLTSELMADEAPALCSKLIQAVLSSDAELKRVALAELHRRGSAALRDGLAAADADAKSSKALVARLGSKAAVEDAREIAALTEFAAEILETMSQFPADIDSLPTRQRELLRAKIGLFSEHMPHLTTHLLLIVLARMKRPWEIMGVLRQLNSASDDRIVSATSEGGVIGDRLLGEAERFAHRLEAADLSQTVAEQTLAELGRVSDLLTGFTEELGVRKDGQWGERIYACRRTASAAMERQLENALKTVRACLPVRRAGGASGVLTDRPALTETVGPDAAAQAINASRLIMGCRDAASRFAFEAAYADTRAKAMKAACSYADGLLDELRAAGQGERENAGPLVDCVEALLEVFTGGDNAAVFRRRANAAQAA